MKLEQRRLEGGNLCFSGCGRVNNMGWVAGWLGVVEHGVELASCACYHLGNMTTLICFVLCANISCKDHCKCLFFFFVCSCFLIKKHVWSVYYSLHSRRIGRLCFRVGKTFLIFSSRSIFSRKFKKKYIKKYQLRIIDDPSEIQVHDII